MQHNKVGEKLLWVTMRSLTTIAFNMKPVFWMLVYMAGKQFTIPQTNSVSTVPDPISISVTLVCETTRFLPLYIEIQRQDGSWNQQMGKTGWIWGMFYQ